MEDVRAITWTEKRGITVLADHQILTGPYFQVKILDSDPTDLYEGMMWYNTTDGQLKLYDGSTIIAFNHA